MYVQSYDEWFMCVQNLMGSSCVYQAEMSGSCVYTVMMSSSCVTVCTEL